MREIQLTNGGYALVDDEDYSFASQFRWGFYLHGDHQKIQYVRRRVGQKVILLHREIMKASAGQVVDHIDGNGLNNQKSNLRLCSQRENSRNQRKPGGTTSSKFKGVSWEKRRGYWVAGIKHNWKRKEIGRFSCEVEAARAYDKAAKELFGEFAKLNFPEGVM